MIGTDVGDIEAADAVFENAHAVGVEAADHRPTGAGREAGAGDAGFIRQGVREIRASLPQNLVTVDAVDNGRERIRIARERRGGDDHLSNGF